MIPTKKQNDSLIHWFTWNPKDPLLNGCLVKQVCFIIRLKQPQTSGCLGFFWQKKVQPNSCVPVLPKNPHTFPVNADFFFGGIKPRKAPNSFQDPWGSETWRFGDGFTCNSKGRNPKVSYQKLFETLDWLENPPWISRCISEKQVLSMAIFRCQN